MATATKGRQTVLQEYLSGFPYLVSQGSGKKTHYVHEDNVESSLSGTSYCGRFTVRCKRPRTKLDVLQMARNPCAMCLRRMEDAELDVLAAMASAASQHEITRDDIRETDE